MYSILQYFEKESLRQGDTFLKLSKTRLPWQQDDNMFEKKNNSSSRTAPDMTITRCDKPENKSFFASQLLLLKNTKPEE